jgi:hypothetical protein
MRWSIRSVTAGECSGRGRLQNLRDNCKTVLLVVKATTYKHSQALSRNLQAGAVDLEPARLLYVLRSTRQPAIMSCSACFFSVNPAMA